MFNKVFPALPYAVDPIFPRDLAGGPSLQLEGLTVGGSGEQITGLQSATVAWTPGVIASGASSSKAVTVTGAVVGNAVFVGVYPALPAGVVASGQVTAGDTVTITLGNLSGGSVTLAAGTVRAVVVQF